MLILKRRAGESVVISEDVFCTVLGFSNGVVRLAFDAPKSITVHRDEVQQRIWDEKSTHEADYLHKENVVDRLIRRFKAKKDISESLISGKPCFKAI